MATGNWQSLLKEGQILSKGYIILRPKLPSQLEQDFRAFSQNKYRTMLAFGLHWIRRL